MSVVTLIVGYILYTVDPPQMPVLPLVLFLTMHTFSPFLAQISSLTQLYDSRPFTLVFALTRLFKYFLSSPKFFWHQLFYYFLIQLFFFFLLASFLCFSLFSGFFHTRVDTSLFSPFLLLVNFGVMYYQPQYFQDYLHPSQIIYIHLYLFHMFLVIQVAFYLIYYHSSTIVCSIYIFDLDWPCQFLLLKSLLPHKLFIHK